MTPNGESLLELETQLHTLLCGSLEEPARTEALRRVADDEAARRLLGEMLDCQRSCRAAFGYDRAGPAMAASLPRVRQVLAEGATARRGGQPRARRNGLRRLFRANWAWRIAAGIVVAVSAYMAVSAHLNYRQLLRRLGEVGERVVALSQVTAEDAARYKRIWQEIVAPDDTAVPWIALRGGVGRFEYLPAAEAGPAGLVLLRCSVVTDEGQVLEEFSLLLPRNRSAEVALGESRALGGRRMLCQVDSQDRWVGLGLQVDPQQAGGTGVRGRVELGGKPAEIGRFRLDQESLSVFLHAVPLGNSLG